MTAWLIGQLLEYWPWLLGLLSIPVIYLRGKHNGKVAAHRDTLESYEKRRKAADNADLGTGASDSERIKRLSEFSRKP